MFCGHPPRCRQGLPVKRVPSRRQPGIRSNIQHHRMRPAGQDDLLEHIGHFKRRIHLDASVTSQISLGNRGWVGMIHPNHWPGLRPKPPRRKYRGDFLKRAPNILIGSAVRQSRQTHRRLFPNVIFDHLSSSFSEKLKITRQARCAEHGRCHAKMRPKGPRKALDIAVPRTPRDHRYRPICLDQPMPRLVRSDSPHRLRTGLADHRNKDTVPVEPRHRRDIRQGIKRQISRWIVVNVLHNPPHPRFV